MNFAVLGDDPDVLPLVHAIAGHRRHRIVAGALNGSLQTELHRIAPALRFLPGWEGILTIGNVEAVLVCGTDEAILTAAKQIAAAGLPLLILPKVAQGSTWIYELGLIRDEGRVWLAPVFIDRVRPIFGLLRSRIRSGSLGRILYLRIDREIPHGEIEGGAPLLSRSQFEEALLQDVDLLRSLGGDYSRVSAILSGSMNDRLAAAGITLSGELLPEATWTARATASEPQYKLVIAGEKGELSATAVGEPRQWSLRGNGAMPSTVEGTGGDELSSLLASFESLPEISTGTLVDDFSKIPHIEESGRRSLPDGERAPGELSAPAVPDAAADWSDLVRAFEIIDAARVSVRRRRAIDLHFETASERNIFKSQMTALGCLVLVLTLFGVMFLLLAMPLLDVRTRAQVEAEQARSLLRQSEFVPGTATLDDQGTRHVAEIAVKMGGTRFPILIERSGPPDDRKLDEGRREAVIGRLKARGVKDAAQRTQVAPVLVRWYAPALRVVRVLAFVPLALFLLLQLFILLARPGTK